MFEIDVWFKYHQFTVEVSNLSADNHTVEVTTEGGCKSTFWCDTEKQAKLLAGALVACGGKMAHSNGEEV